MNDDATKLLSRQVSGSARVAGGGLTAETRRRKSAWIY